jgi:hypothetical protein
LDDLAAEEVRNCECRLGLRGTPHSERRKTCQQDAYVWTKKMVERFFVFEVITSAARVISEKELSGAAPSS